MSWLQKLLDDETVFPTKSGEWGVRARKEVSCPDVTWPRDPLPTTSLSPHIGCRDDSAGNPLTPGREFPNSFAYTAKHIYKHLFRIFAHIYHAHFEQILHLSIEAHFNSLFAHFLAFGKEFDLLVMKDLMTPQGMGQGVAELSDKWREMGVLEV